MFTAERCVAITTALRILYLTYCENRHEAKIVPLNTELPALVKAICHGLPRLDEHRTFKVGTWPSGERFRDAKSFQYAPVPSGNV